MSLSSNFLLVSLLLQELHQNAQSLSSHVNPTACAFLCYGNVISHATASMAAMRMIMNATKARSLRTNVIAMNSSFTANTLESAFQWNGFVIKSSTVV